MKAQVSGEVILIIAVLLSVSLLLVQVQQLANFQIASTKEAMTKSIAKDIVAIIDGMGSVTGNATYTYEPPRKLYSVNITEGFVFAVGRDGQLASVPYTYDCVIPNSIENEREIIIRKMTGCIVVGSFERCSASSDCDSGYCWSTERESYICHDKCADHLHYAPDADSCCPGRGWDEATKLCYDNLACAGHESECDMENECCSDLLCVDDAGSSTKGHCCLSGWIWNSASGRCQRPPITYGILIIPINWDNKLNYNSIADSIGDYYLERIPLRECPGQFEALKADLSTNYGSRWTDGYCDVSSHERPGQPSCYKPDVLTAIYLCADEYSAATGNIYDFVVGVDDDNIALYDPRTDNCKYSVGGWSDGAGFSPAVIAESTDVPTSSGIIVHELGHEFGLMEQYCDCTGNPNAEMFCTTLDIISNPLRQSLGCGGAGDASCFTGFSAQINGEQCPEIRGNYDMMSLDASNSPVANAKRTAMSNRVLSGEYGGYYSMEEYNILTADPRMRCIQ